MRPLYASLICIYLLLCGSAHASSPQNRDPVIGHVSWAIYSVQSKRVIGRGSKVVHLHDVKITRPSARAMKKQIALGSWFVLAYSEIPQPSRSSLAGLGLMAGKKNNTTYSWEWFRVDRIGHAKKIQEKGEIYFRQGKVGKHWEISKMSFPTNISCRVINFPQDRDPRRARWRVIILKGSWIVWPKLVKGKVLAN